MKSVLIIGKNSYVGESCRKWLEQYPDEYTVSVVASTDGAWKKIDFSRYETVVDFAGVAHINKKTEEMREVK